jgi:lactoylglutathione lyase
MSTTEFRPTLLHTMLRVRDLDAMLAFYCGALGMREIRRIEFRDQRYTLIFCGFPGDATTAQIEFWHEWDRTLPYERGSAYGHLGVGVRDIQGFCGQLQAAGVKILRQPGAMRPGGRVIALIEDPEGNEVELLAND